MNIVLAPCLALLLAGCTSLMFQPTRIQYSDPDALGIETEDLYIADGDKLVLHGWRLPAAGTTRGSVVFLHGNAENISSHIGGIHWLPAKGYEVFLFDYRGYGRSTGSAELDGIVQDAQRMIEYAREHASSPDRTLTVLGHSMGGSIAIYALARLQDKTCINGLVTVSAFSDYRLITRDALAGHWLTRPLRWPLSFMVSNRYSPVDAIGDLPPIPVVVMHSDADEVVPAHHAEQLFHAARPPRRYTELEGTHNRSLALETNRERLLETLEGLNRPTHTLDAEGACESATDKYREVP